MSPGFTQPLIEMSTEQFLGVKRCWRVRLTAQPPSVSRLYRQCGILDISQPHRPLRPDAGIALLFCVVFIVCNMTFIVCVALGAVFCLTVAGYFV
jgi:hypothetical protein